MLAQTEIPTAAEIRAIIAKIITIAFDGSEQRWLAQAADHCRIGKAEERRRHMGQRHRQCQADDRLVADGEATRRRR